MPGHAPCIHTTMGGSSRAVYASHAPRAPAAAHLHGADGVGDDRALAGGDVERDVHARQRRQDVREQDHAVRPERAPRLQRDLHLRAGATCRRIPCCKPYDLTLPRPTLPAQPPPEGKRHASQRTRARTTVARPLSLCTPAARRSSQRVVATWAHAMGPMTRARESVRGAWAREQTNTARQRADPRSLRAPRLVLSGMNTRISRTSVCPALFLLYVASKALGHINSRGAPPGLCSPSARGRSGAFCTAPGTPARGDTRVIQAVLSSVKSPAEVQTATSRRAPSTEKQAHLAILCMRHSCLLRAGLPSSTFAPDSPRTTETRRARLHVPACLPHHPHRRPLHGLAAQRAQQQRLRRARLAQAPPSALPADCRARGARTAPPSAPQRRRLHPLEQCAGSGDLSRAADCNPHGEPRMPTKPCKLKRLLAPSLKRRAAPPPPQQREGGLCSAVAAAVRGGPELCAVAPSHPAAQHKQVSAKWIKTCIVLQAPSRPSTASVRHHKRAIVCAGRTTGNWAAIVAKVEL